MKLDASNFWEVFTIAAKKHDWQIRRLAIQMGFDVPDKDMTSGEDWAQLRKRYASSKSTRQKGNNRPADESEEYNLFE